MSTSIYTDHFCNLCNSRATYLSNKNRYWCSRNPSSCPGVKEIRKQKSLEKYGTDNPPKSKVIKDKISAINAGLADRAKIQRKNQYKSKLYTFPSGREVCVQGYEPRAIDQLLLHYTEDEIVVETAQIPRIEHLGIDKKTHYYFPDIFIPKENLIIEVKSIWTYEQDKKTVLLKEQACIAAGFNYKFIIY